MGPFDGLRKVAEEAFGLGGEDGYRDAYAKSQVIRADCEKPFAERREVEMSLYHFPREAIQTETVEVVGESHRQDAISAVTGRKGTEAIAFRGEAVLVPDWENHPDRPNTNATAIHLKGDGQVAGLEHVGYLSHDDGIRYRQAIEGVLGHGRLIGCEATVRAVAAEKAKTPNAGVKLYLPSPETILALLADS